MNKQDFICILQVALWSYEGVSELEIRQRIAKLTSDGIIKSGIKLAQYLNSIEVKHDKQM